MDILLLHNRAAGGQDPSPARLLALLRREGYDPRYFDLHPALQDPTTLPRAEFAVVAGGDGSFREAALKLAGRGLPLAVLPLGTANNVARTLGITGSIPGIIASWNPGRRARYDIGVARGPWGEERFVEGVGIGLFARIIEILSHVKDPDVHVQSGPPHRVASDLRSTTVLAHEMAPVLVEATLDGDRLSGQFLLLEIMNSGHVGAGIELARADVSDGQFDVVHAQLPEREKLLASLRNVATAEPAPSLLTTRRGRDVELILPPCEFRLDDRVIVLADPARVHLSMSPESIELVLPATADASHAAARARA
ncbi:MAG TPA: diacylglycerol kinase family protein [Lacunisphaera sp.]|nr:diacylglycerol kinase family protein [Lacunisphaera sp.]